MTPLRPIRLVLAAVVLALAVGLVPGPRTATTVGASTYGFALYRQGDFVAQTNLYQCVGASMQMMINMIEPRNDRTAGTQRYLWRLARKYSPPRPPDQPPRKGASVRGWAAGLNVLDAGPYRVVGFDSIDEAARAAAHAMRATGKPVGLLVWRGRHAWVMSGFRATADPRKTSRFRVTHVQVLDPLYPRGSSVWGPSPRPGTQLSLRTLGQDFVQRRNNRTSSLAGKWVIVMPVSDAVGGLRSGMRWIVRPTPPGRPSEAARKSLAAADTAVLQLRLSR